MAGSWLKTAAHTSLGMLRSARRRRAFPPFFAQALVARLAAEFCLPLTESASRSEVLFRLAEAELRQARLVDSQQDTPRAIEGFPLVDVRG